MAEIQEKKNTENCSLKFNRLQSLKSLKSDYNHSKLKEFIYLSKCP